MRKEKKEDKGEKVEEMGGKERGEEEEVGEEEEKDFGKRRMDAPKKVVKEEDEKKVGMDEEWRGAVKDSEVEAKKALQELREIARSY